MIVLSAHTDKRRTLQGAIALPSSKSISNRALLLESLCPALKSGDTQIANLSTCDDTRVLRAALAQILAAPAECHVVDVEGAGTAMRFLTARLAMMPACDVVLTGNSRMRQRPIAPLVDALRGWGADIAYIGQEGYPPLHIRGQKLGRGLPDIRTEIDGSISSQFISALLIMAPCLGAKVHIHLTQPIVSRPYINMTLALMARYGAQARWTSDDTLAVCPGCYHPCSLTIENDWSAASYWIAMQRVALRQGFSFQVHWEGLYEDSIQGDSSCSELLGREPDATGTIRVDCSPCPDLVPTLSVAWALTGQPFHISGVSTLRIKETDRLNALATEMRKLGFVLTVEDDALAWDGSLHPQDTDESLRVIHTWGDHRMAMALVPAVFVFGRIGFDHPDVVTKSYPGFWDEIEKIGIAVETINE